MAIGTDGLGWIDFDDYALARRIGIIALALILFEGGLTSGLLEIRPVLVPALSLAVIGTIVTAVVTGLAAALLFDLSTLDGLLLGSVLAATDGAAIFALLRGSTLKRRLATTLEGESGFNDPVAVLLVLGFIEWLKHDSYGIGDMAVLFVRQLGIGLAIGLVVGVASVWVLRRVQLATAGLYPVATLAVAALAFGGADALHGSGFLAVYLAGLALGTAGVPAQQTVTSFHQGLAWVGQVAMFVALGLLVFPSHLDDVAFRGTVLALVLVFVSRPVAVAVSTLPMRFTWTERAVLAGAGLRGAVPVVLATFPVIEGVSGSTRLFDVVFFAVLLSTLIQGTTFEPVARWLGATTDEPALPRPLAEAGAVKGPGAGGVGYPLAGRGPGGGARGPRRGRSGAWARRCSSTPSPTTTRWSARACATSGCRARPWSTSSCATARRSRRAARPSCAPAIACTSCCAPSSRATCTPSSSAGARGRSARPRARRGSWRDGVPPSRSRPSARSRSRATRRMRARSQAPRWSRSCACGATSRAASSPSRTGATPWSVRWWRSARAGSWRAGRRAGCAACRPTTPSGRGCRTSWERWRPTCRSRDEPGAARPAGCKPPCGRQDSPGPRRTARPCTTASSMAPWPASSRRPPGSSPPRPRTAPRSPSRSCAAAAATARCTATGR